MSPDVEAVLPSDPIADLTRLAAQGEGQHLEYKQKLPDNRDEKRTVFKTVVAFANGGGGFVMFGVSDTGDFRGLPETVPMAKHRLNDLLRELVTPSPQTRITAHTIRGKTILLLEVMAGTGVLHALTLDSNKPEYYARRDGTTYYARPDEITSVVQSTS